MGLPEFIASSKLHVISNFVSNFPQMCDANVYSASCETLKFLCTSTVSCYAFTIAAACKHFVLYWTYLPLQRVALVVSTYSNKTHRLIYRDEYKFLQCCSANMGCVAVWQSSTPNSYHWARNTNSRLFGTSHYYWLLECEALKSVRLSFFLNMLSCRNWLRPYGSVLVEGAWVLHISFHSVSLSIFCHLEFSVVP